jgi:hypothetical protein
VCGRSATDERMVVDDEKPKGDKGSEAEEEYEGVEEESEVGAEDGDLSSVVGGIVLLMFRLMTIGCGDTQICRAVFCGRFTIQFRYLSRLIYRSFQLTVFASCA